MRKAKLLFLLCVVPSLLAGCSSTSYNSVPPALAIQNYRPPTLGSYTAATYMKSERLARRIYDLRQTQAQEEKLLRSLLYALSESGLVERDSVDDLANSLAQGFSKGILI